MIRNIDTRRTYQRPTLKKGPKLADVAAGAVGSPAKKVTNCWVARAAFGHDDIRWQVFRAWLMEDAPIWFRKAYIRYGAQVGAWLEGRESARAVVRAAMMVAVRRKLLR